MSQPQSKFEDPKIQLIFSIQKHDEKITFFLEQGQYLNAGRSLHYLLNRLEINDESADREMRELRDTVTIDNYHSLTEHDFDIAYIILHKFLNRTYYKGFSNNRPPTRERSMHDLQMTVDKAQYDKAMEGKE
jgi:hypothetical protein